MPVKETHKKIPPEAIFFEVCKEKLEVLTLLLVQLYVSADYRKTRFFRNRRPPARKHMCEKRVTREEHWCVPHPPSTSSQLTAGTSLLPRPLLRRPLSTWSPGRVSGSREPGGSLGGRVSGSWPHFRRHPMRHLMGHPMRHPMRHHTRRPARHHTRRLDASFAHASLAAAEAFLLLAPRLWEALGRAACASRNDSQSIS